MRINWKVLIISLAIVYGISFVGSLFTSSTVNSDWYDSVKPSITSPNWVFPVVWNILFFLIALSLYFAWTSTRKKDKSTKKRIAIIFGINLFLNVAWSFLFFRIQNPLWAFFELIVLWFSIISMLVLTWRIKKLSFYFLIPYSLWVSFAGILNWLIAFG
ncbi:TspO protein [Candidatus Pacearchaeota archaeon CG10_big_fil_rev_8_21_14_0_10_34_12]|nr:MAG: TspO protein [Candidatus Pacearchaeota archaeon CG10_big_fil_rev_8_21_14_0_10_34_12]